MAPASYTSTFLPSFFLTSFRNGTAVGSTVATSLATVAKQAKLSAAVNNTIPRYCLQQIDNYNESPYLQGDIAHLILLQFIGKVCIVIALRLGLVLFTLCMYLVRGFCTRRPNSGTWKEEVRGLPPEGTCSGSRVSEGDPTVEPRRRKFVDFRQWLLFCCWLDARMRRPDGQQRISGAWRRFSLVLGSWRLVVALAYCLLLLLLFVAWRFTAEL